MLNKLGRVYLKSKIWLKCKMEDFKENEKGVSGIVATVILVLVAVLLAIYFKKEISGFITRLWSSVTGKEAELTSDI